VKPTHFTLLTDLIRKEAPALMFNILEVGARPIAEESEPFYQLLDTFPASRVSAFEIDDALCAELNKTCPNGVKYYSQALAGGDGTVDLYETVHPMCSSLYEPNEQLLDRYNGLEVVYKTGISPVNTTSLDRFISEQEIGLIDFIKIDVQGAELDIFSGGKETLQSVLLIVTEVEFIELYKNQPLFGDVSAFLSSQRIMFHKFLGLCGRSIKPIILRNDVHASSQHMWSDAVYHRCFEDIEKLPGEGLLKLALLSFMYGSPDLTYFCLQIYDAQGDSELHKQMLQVFA
jgi:FkbM family methyltransferase